MSKHKIRYILSLLAVIASATCVGTTGPSEKAANAVKPKQEKNLCPEPVDQVDEDCLEITLLKLENRLDVEHKDLFRCVVIKDPKLHGLSKQHFINIHSEWKVYREELCSGPTVTTDLKTPSDKILYLYDVQQTQHHLKVLGCF